MQPREEAARAACNARPSGRQFCQPATQRRTRRYRASRPPDLHTTPLSRPNLRRCGTAIYQGAPDQEVGEKEAEPSQTDVRGKPRLELVINAPNKYELLRSGSGGDPATAGPATAGTHQMEASRLVQKRNPAEAGSSCVKQAQLRRRRRRSAIPASPKPISASEPGSGISVISHSSPTQELKT